MSSSEGLPRKPYTPAESVPVGASAEDFDSELVASIPELHRYAGFLTKSAQEVDDLTQETLRKALEHKDGFKIGTNMHAWLRTIMQNTFTSQKRLMVNKTANEGDPDEMLERIPIQGNQESTVDLKKVLTFIEGRLPRNQRMALELQAVGHTESEIAKEMKIQEGTVKAHLHRARKKLDEYRDYPTDQTRP